VPPRLVYVVPAEHAEELDSLRTHFAGEPQVEVVVERRGRDGDAPVQRRAPVAERDPGLAMPAGLAPDGLRLVQPLEPVGRALEAAQLDDLIERSIAAEPDAVSELWWRIGERAMARLRLRVGAFLVQGLTSQLLGRMLDELPGYDPRREPLTAWLDRVVDRFAADAA
jgi:hypothetical protein